MSAHGDSSIAEGLALVARLLEAEVARMRAAGIPVGEDEYRGLYISEAETDRLLRASRRPAVPVEDDSALIGLRAEFEALVTSAGGPLGRLVGLAKLSAFDAGCLLVGLASEADLGSERLIAYVQDDVSKRRPRVDLALRLFAKAGDAAAARAAFHTSAPLRRLRLLTLHDEPGQPHTPLLARYLALDPRVAEFLLGGTRIEESVQLHGDLSCDPREMESLTLPDELGSRVGELAALPATNLRPAVIALTGTDPSRVRAVAAQLAKGAGLGLLSLDLPSLAGDVGFDLAVTLATREAGLIPAALLLRRLEQLRSDEAAQLHTRLQAEPLAPLVLLASADGATWPGMTVAIPEPDFDARLSLWESHVQDEPDVTPDDLAAIAGKFRLSTQGIDDAVAAARGSAQWRCPGSPALEIADLYAAARTQSTPILNNLARKIVPHYTWEDIILVPDTLDQLREMCGHVEHRHLVYDIWGFEKKLALSKGLIALFAGQSGTGKTMAADVIAGALGLDLYKIDLSGVVSKYIGETEKNLGSIFAEAESSNAILFFDEADALFGKRSEVKDAHDRYANIETAYLLQKMEEYSGPVILATNLKMNLDEAFMRRLHFVVDFPMPDEAERLRIWKSTLPADLPVVDDVDFAFLARQFKISGGNIRNIVLAGAFLAAADGSGLAMSHLIRATRREFQKLGRMVTEAEFGPYVGLVRT